MLISYGKFLSSYKFIVASFYLIKIRLASKLFFSRLLSSYDLGILDIVRKVYRAIFLHKVSVFGPIRHRAEFCGLGHHSLHPVFEIR